MTRYLDVDGYHINKDEFTDEEYIELKKNLSVSPLDNLYAKDVPVYKQYSRNETEIIIPKFYGIKNFGSTESVKHTPKKVNIKFLKELKDYQVPIVSKCMKHIRKKSGCILSVPCGRGKTVMAIKIAQELG